MIRIKEDQGVLNVSTRIGRRMPLLALLLTFLLAAVPFYLTSFGYHGCVPSLAKHYQQQARPALRPDRPETAAPTLTIGSSEVASCFEVS